MPVTQCRTAPTPYCRSMRSCSAARARKQRRQWCPVKAYCWRAATPCRTRRCVAPGNVCESWILERAARVEAAAVREPSIGVALGGVGGTAAINATLSMLVHLICDAGGNVPNDPIALAAALADEKTDAIMAVGGTGTGRRDGAVQELARLGQVDAHGIG